MEKYFVKCYNFSLKSHTELQITFNKKFYVPRIGLVKHEQAAQGSYHPWRY